MSFAEWKISRNYNENRQTTRLEYSAGHTGEITAAIAGGSLLLLGIVSLVLYRNWKYEQELDSLLWKVDYKEIQLHENEKESSGQKQTRVRYTHFVILFFGFISNSYINAHIIESLINN